MSLTRQWTYLFGCGFTGGPDFDHCDDLKLDLEGIELAVTVPRDNIIVEDMSQRINFPFRSTGWFDRNHDQTANHYFVSALAYNWAYSGPFWRVLNEPFGVLSFGVWLKRVRYGAALSMNDLSTLEKTIHTDYEEYFESGDLGKYGLGHNSEVRLKAEQMFAPKPYPSNRDLNAEKARYLSKYLRQIPEHFERRAYSGREWVCYQLQREPNYPVHHYCQPLDGQFYLDVRFHYGIDYRQYFHLWKAHAEAAEQRIMNSVRLTFPNS